MRFPLTVSRFCRFFLASSAVLLVGVGLTVQAAPEPAEEEFLHLDYCQAAYERLREETVVRYTETHSDPPALAQRVERWLDQCARADADLGGAGLWDELTLAGDRLIEAGCEHPLVVSYLAHCDQVRGRLQRSQERFDRSAAPLLAGEYGLTNRYLTALRGWMLASHSYRSEREKKARERAADAWLDMAVAETQPLRLRMVWEDWLSLNKGYQNSEPLTDFIQRAAIDERLNFWLRKMFAGLLSHNQAWRARGGGYASSVDDKQWEYFHAAIDEAAAHYEAAHEQIPTLPEAATALIGVAMAKGGAAAAEDTRYWFDRAREAQYDYLPAYEALTWSKRPRWHGSKRELWELAVEWAKEGRFDTNVPFQAFDVAMTLGNEFGDWHDMFEEDPPYQLAVDMLEGMIDHQSHDPEARRYLSRPQLLTHRWGLAVATGRDEEGLEIQQTLDDEGIIVSRSVMNKYGLEPRLHASRQFARTGPASEAVKALGALSWEARRASRDTRARTAEAYAKAKRETADPRADYYFDTWIFTYSRERDFFDGGWVDLPLDDSMIGWNLGRAGFWRNPGDGSVIMSETFANDPWMYSSLHVEGPLELECTIEPLYETGKFACPGLLVSGDEGGLYFWINRTLKGGAITYGRDCGRYGGVPDQPSYRVTARVWPGYAEMLVDGKQIASREVEGFEPNGAFGLAAVERLANSATVRFSDVRIRKLAPRQKPAAPSAKDDGKPDS